MADINSNEQQNQTNQQVEELMGPPVDISILQRTPSRSDVERAAFDLYKEAATVITVIAHLYEGFDEAQIGLQRNQAICVGLLIRVAKLMLVITQLSAKDDRREVVMALNRCIAESCVNLEFLVSKNEDRFYTQYVEFSLGPERELYDRIQTNIQSRGGEIWPIEQRMLNSIDRTCKASHVKIEDVKIKYPDWGNNLRDRLKAINKEDQYLGIQRIGSHAIHGTWVDLFLHHLEWDETTDSFRPEPNWSRMDARGLLPTAVFVLTAVIPYVGHYFQKHTEIKLILKRIDDLIDRVRAVDEIHEQLMNKKPSISQPQIK